MLHRDKYEASLTDYAAKNTALQQQLDTKSEEALQMSGDATKLATVQQQLGEVREDLTHSVSVNYVTFIISADILPKLSPVGSDAHPV